MLQLHFDISKCHFPEAVTFLTCISTFSGVTFTRHSHHFLAFGRLRVQFSWSCCTFQLHLHVFGCNCHEAIACFNCIWTMSGITFMRPFRIPIVFGRFRSNFHEPVASFCCILDQFKLLPLPNATTSWKLYPKTARYNKLQWPHENHTWTRPNATKMKRPHENEW